MKPDWTFPHAFRLQPSDLVAFVGGGGKTSLMFALAQAWRGRVVTTTTTRIFATQMRHAPIVLSISPEETTDAQFVFFQAELVSALDRFGHCLVVGPVSGDKAIGVSPALPARFLTDGCADLVLVEADGSRMRPVKAPAVHEPVVPPEATLVVPVVGIDALNGRIADVAHRPEILCKILGKEWSPGARLTPSEIGCLLTHPQGGLKGVPELARVIPFINKVETAEQRRWARMIARDCLQSERIEQVVIGAAQSKRPIWEVQRRVTAVILAAGQAKRMGQTKQLLPWGQTTVLGQTIRQVKASEVHDWLVVAGHEAAAVAEVVTAEGGYVVYNPAYAEGEMVSSLKTAVRQLSPLVSAVLVVLGDQPMIAPETINQLLTAYWEGAGELIAPVYQGRRGNPVLIGRPYFEALLNLPPGEQPRALLQRYAAELYLVETTDEAILWDLDTMADYQRWQPDSE